VTSLLSAIELQSWLAGGTQAGMAAASWAFPPVPGPHSNHPPVPSPSSAQRSSGGQPAATPVAWQGWLAAQRPEQPVDILRPGFVMQFHGLPLGQRLQVIGQLVSLRQPGATDEDRDSADIASQDCGQSRRT
jgi:hypothetical protein